MAATTQTVTRVIKNIMCRISAQVGVEHVNDKSNLIKYYNKRSGIPPYVFLYIYLSVSLSMTQHTHNPTTKVGVLHSPMIRLS